MPQNLFGAVNTTASEQNPKPCTWESSKTRGTAPIRCSPWLHSSSQHYSCPGAHPVSTGTPIHCLKPWGVQFSKGEHLALDVAHNPPQKKTPNPADLGYPALLLPTLQMPHPMPWGIPQQIMAITPPRMLCSKPQEKLIIIIFLSLVRIIRVTH